MIKLFDSDPVKFYEQFKLGLPRKNKSTLSTIIGDIVDFYVLECGGDEQEFDKRMNEKFSLMEGIKGTGQVFQLADILYEITQQSVNEEGKVNTEFNTRFGEAYRTITGQGKYKGKTQTQALEDFNENGLLYFQALLFNKEKTVVDILTLNKGRKIAKILLTDGFTSDLFTEKSGVEYFTKFPIEWRWDGNSGWDCKSEVDMLVVDHNKRRIYIKDLKTTFDNENFEISYLKYGYYIQAAFYYKAVRWWKNNNASHIADYKVMPVEFVVADTSSNNRRPIVYKMSQEDMDKASEGFTLKGTKYRGLEDIAEEIIWCEENKIWNCSRDVYEKSGELNLNLKYE